MGKSVRLHHPTFASCNYVVELAQKYESPYDCFSCKQVHLHKAIHLHLDANGDVFVAEGILELLRTVPTMAGLEVVPGRNAPGQVIGAVEQPKQHIILPTGTKYVPGWNKYEAAERMQKLFEPIVEQHLERVDRVATKVLAEKKRTFILGRRRD